MLKRLLLSSIILSSIGLSAQAIDINIPGADPSVASNAYENYVFSDEYIKLDKTKMVNESYEASKKGPHFNNISMSVVKVNRLEVPNSHLGDQ